MVNGQNDVFVFSELKPCCEEAVTNINIEFIEEYAFLWINPRLDESHYSFIIKDDL